MRTGSPASREGGGFLEALSELCASFLFLWAFALCGIAVTILRVGSCQIEPNLAFVERYFDGWQYTLIVLTHGLALALIGCASDRWRVIQLGVVSAVFFLSWQVPMSLLPAVVCGRNGCDLLPLSETLPAAVVMYLLALGAAYVIRSLLGERELDVSAGAQLHAFARSAWQVSALVLSALFLGFGVAFLLRRGCLVQMDLAVHWLHFVMLDQFMFAVVAYFVACIQLGRRSLLGSLPVATVILIINALSIVLIGGSTKLAPIPELAAAQTGTALAVAGIIAYLPMLLGWVLVLPFLSEPAPVAPPAPRERKSTAREPLNRPRKDTSRGGLTRPDPFADE